MKTVLVLRHAKSSWDDPSLPDHDRPLAPRGRKALPLLARRLVEGEPIPHLVLCSSAQRARETLAGVQLGLGDAPVRIEPDLYMADSDELIDRLRALPDEAATVMLVGHNPGLQELILDLAVTGDRLEGVREKFPTGGLATVELDVETWDDVAAKTGRLVEVVTPRELG